MQWLFGSVWGVGDRKTSAAGSGQRGMLGERRDFEGFASRSLEYGTALGPMGKSFFEKRVHLKPLLG